MDLVASDLFFGLGAVMLVVVAALSLSLREVVTRSLSDLAPDATDTRQAATRLAVETGDTVLLADAEGLHRFGTDKAELSGLDGLWSDPRLATWLAEDPLLVIAPLGQDAAFLTFSRAAELDPDLIVTLRLTQDCRAIRKVAQGYECQP